MDVGVRAGNWVQLLLGLTVDFKSVTYYRYRIVRRDIEVV